MKLTLTKLSDDLKFTPRYSGELLKVWLQYNGIYIGSEYSDHLKLSTSYPAKNWEVEYNQVYHFYDVHLYALECREEVNEKKWLDVVLFFKKEGYKVKVSRETWQWVLDKNGKDTVLRKGIRLWVYPKSEEV